LIGLRMILRTGGVAGKKNARRLWGVREARASCVVRRATAYTYTTGFRSGASTHLRRPMLVGISWLSVLRVIGELKAAEQREERGKASFL